VNGTSNPPAGLIERVEFHARVLDHLVKYQAEMRAFFLRRIEELQADLRGNSPTPDFPSFEQWVEMTKTTRGNGAEAMLMKQPRDYDEERPSRRPGADYLGARD
jgi:hypothetical protein